MSDLRQKVLRGITWSLASQGGNEALRFGFAVVLARLLSPREFGLVAMITVITGFAAKLSELGLSAALLQKQEVQQDCLSSVFWVNVGCGFMLMAGFMLGSSLLGGFYGEPILGPLTIVLSTTFFIGSLQNIQSTLMTRALDFRRLSIVQLISVGTSGIVGVMMAYYGLGVWSLAFQAVIGTLVSGILLWKLCKWQPSFTFKWGAIKELVAFSGNLLGSRALNYLVRNLDTVLIGRFLGSGPLGVYNRAYTTMLFPLTNLSYVVSKVMFPSLSIIQKDRSRVKAIYLQMTSSIALITFPLMCGLFVTSRSFVMVVFGQQWAQMIPILQIFCLSGIWQSVLTLSGNLFLSQGRTDLLLKIDLFRKPIPILAIIVGLRWGIVGVAIGLMIASVINLFPSLFFAGRLVSLTIWEVLTSLSGISACSVAMAVSVWGLGFALPIEWPHGARFSVQVPFGVVVYWTLIHIFGLRAYRAALTLIGEYVRPPQSSVLGTSSQGAKSRSG